MVGPDTSLTGGLIAAGALLAANASVPISGPRPLPGEARGGPTRDLIADGKVVEPAVAASASTCWSSNRRSANTGSTASTTSSWPCSKSTAPFRSCPPAPRRFGRSADSARNTTRPDAALPIVGGFLCMVAPGETPHARQQRHFRRGPGAGELPWPELVARRLSAAWGTRVSVEHRRFAPYGPRAVSYALGCVEETQPDLVMVILAAYNGVIGYVHLRVRRRLENAPSASTFAWSAALTAARGATASRRRSTHGRGGLPAGSSGRQRTHRCRRSSRPTRAPPRPVAARRRAGPGCRRSPLRAIPARLNPGLMRNILRVHARVRPVVEEHRFLWVDGEAGSARTRTVSRSSSGTGCTSRRPATRSLPAACSRNW